MNVGPVATLLCCYFCCSSEIAVFISYFEANFNLTDTEPVDYCLAAACTHFSLGFIYLFLERGREEERERNMVVRETTIGCLLSVPLLGTEPATQACALTGNQTSDPSLGRTTLNRLSHAGQGVLHTF